MAGGFLCFVPADAHAVGVCGLARSASADTNARILKRKNRLAAPENVSDEFAATLRSFDRQRDEEVLNEFVRPFANEFLVSTTAMRIRLERSACCTEKSPINNRFPKLDEFFLRRM